MERKIRVLVVDDEPFVRDSLCEILAAEGLQAASAKSVREAKAALEKRGFDVIVSDVRMPGESGVALVDVARSRIPPIPIVLVTGVGTVKEAVAAMKKGAFDFVQKPVDPEALVLLVKRAAEHKALLDEVATLREAHAAGGAPVIVGASAAMERVRALVAQVARGDGIVLVRGDVGTGKDLVARALHAASARARGPLVRAPLARDPRALAEEWFGHGGVRGRVEEAEGGTLVVEGLERADAAAQATFLRLLESGEYQRGGEAETRAFEARVVVLATADLAQRVKSGSLRADLYYRVSTFPIELLPLAEHKEDLASLAAHWFARRAGPASAGAALTPDALDVLASYDWPGNVRELENVLERAAIVAGPAGPTPELLRAILESGGAHQGPQAEFEFNIRANLDAREKELLLGALERAKGKKRDASDLLGIDARNLGYYLRKHKIQERGAPEGSHE